jgi:enediyne biosynthesis protein E4
MRALALCCAPLPPAAAALAIGLRDTTMRALLPCCALLVSAAVALAFVPVSVSAATNLDAPIRVGAIHPSGEPLTGGNYLPAAKSAYNQFESQSLVRALVLSACFSDELGAHPMSRSYATRYFDADRPGSLTHFYDTMSGGRLRLEGQAQMRRYASRSPATAYLASAADKYGDYGTFVVEVLESADPDVDFSQYDNDGPDGVPNSGDDDGRVDYLFVTLVSTPSRFIIGNATGMAALGFPSRYYTDDPSANGGTTVILGSRNLGSLGREGHFSQTVGTMAHEFGHALGLPDLYDLVYSGPEDDSAGIGRWGLMGRGAPGWLGNDGPVAFCAWSLERLGWVEVADGSLLEITQPVTDLALGALAAGGRVAKVFLLSDDYAVDAQVRAGGARRAQQDYLLLEERVRGADYYNRNQPGDGLLVWHVRPGTGNNIDETHRLVDLICADGLYSDAGYPAGRAPSAMLGRDNLDFWSHQPTYTRAHQGNLGDATDLFDGSRFVALNAHSNPSSAATGPFTLAPVSVPGIRVHRGAEGVLVDIAPPRWAGTIERSVTWNGTILVDGDLLIGPDAELTIEAGTQVLIAGTDRLAAGVDRDHVEVTVQGKVCVDISTQGAVPVRFAAAEPGTAWYGIVLDPNYASTLTAPHGVLQLEHSLYGAVVAGSPPDGDALQLGQYRLLDGLEGSTAGNGDGQLQPGESVQLEIQLDNWSWRTVQKAEVQLTWTGDLLTTTWASDGTPQPSGSTDQGMDASVVLGPADRRLLRLPQLTVSSAATAGERAQLRLCTRIGPVEWAVPLTLTVSPGAPTPEISMESPNMPAVGGTVLLSRSERVYVEVRVEGGGADRVDLLMHIPGADQSAVFPLSPQGDGGDCFAGYCDALSFSPLESETAELVARVQMQNGSVALAPQRLSITGLPDKWQPLLALSAAGGMVGESNRRETQFAKVLDIAGMTANYGNESEVAELAQAMLQHYIGADRMVVWLSGHPGAFMQTALVQFLESGGKLLVLGHTFHQLQADGPLANWLPFDQLRRKWSNHAIGVDPMSEVDVPVSFYGWFSRLSELALPILQDNEGRTLSYLLERDGGALAYLAIELHWALQDELDLVHHVLEFLVSRLPASGSEPVDDPLSGPTPHLVISDVGQVPALQRLGDLWPRLLVANQGTAESSGYRAVFQARHGEELLLQDQLSRPALAAGDTSSLGFPAWHPPGEGRYKLEFALYGDEEEAPLSAQTLTVEVADLSGHFEPISLPDSTAGNGAALFDYDSDGDLDIYLVRLGAPNQLFRTTVDGFASAGEAAGLDDDGKGRGLAIGDYDGDGDLDLYLVNERANRLLQNQGDGRFTDVAAAAGDVAADAPPGVAAVPGGDSALADGQASGRSAGFLDHDGDGDLDLYLVNATLSNRLFRNDAGRFTDVAADLGLAVAGGGRGLAIGDYDADGDPDLYVASQSTTFPSELFRNDMGTRGRFEPASIAAGLAASGYDVAAVFGDYDGDLDLDLFVSNERGANALWRNNLGVFAQVAGASTVALGERSVGAAFVDYDNDGDLDLATTPLTADPLGDQLYHNRGSEGFVAVGSLLGLRPVASGRGLAVGDYDQDGRQDLLVASVDSTILYHSQVGAAHWLQVDLQGTPMNQDALGAQVELALAGGTQYREVHSGYGYGSQAQPRLHFGLGSTTGASSIHVLWPDGQESTEPISGVDQRVLLLHPGLGTAVVHSGAVLPQQVSLGPCWPNPFNSTVMISFSLPAAAVVRLEVYNVAGQRVRRLLEGARPVGVHTVRWDGTDDRGRSVASGVYVLRLRSAGEHLLQRVLLLR